MRIQYSSFSKRFFIFKKVFALLLKLISQVVVACVIVIHLLLVRYGCWGNVDFPRCALIKLLPLFGIYTYRYTVPPYWTLHFFLFLFLTAHWTLQVVGEATVEGRGSVSLGTGRWYPHQLCSQVAATHGSCVRAWDIRSMKPTWCVEAAHTQLVRCTRLSFIALLNIIILIVIVVLLLWSLLVIRIYRYFFLQ